MNIGKIPIDIPPEMDRVVIFFKLSSTLFNMIHIAFKKAPIAYRYYQLKYPERNYSPEQARKQFEQDRHKDVAIIGRIVEEIYKEQKKILKKYDKTLAL